ncbi:hypothetical protein KC338_g245 [Hortaea werneckii]|nr:hypothetical protein KC338_g245 [Hortaea werneckii]
MICSESFHHHFKLWYASKWNTLAQQTLDASHYRTCRSLVLPTLSNHTSSASTVVSNDKAWIGVVIDSVHPWY